MTKSLARSSAPPPGTERVGVGRVEGVGERVEQVGAVRVVDGPAVVGVDEREVEELGALVEVGDAGRRSA